MKLSEESELSEFSQLRTQLPDLDNDDCTTSCDELAVNVQPSPEGHQCECHAEKEEKAPEKRVSRRRCCTLLRRWMLLILLVRLN